MQMCLQWVKYARQTPQQYEYAYALCVCVCVGVLPLPACHSAGFLFALTLSERSEAGQGQQGRPP